MKDIICYSYNDGVLEKLGIVDDFISFNFTRSYSNIGEWTLVLNGYSLNTKRIKGTQIISVSDGVAGLVYKCEENLSEHGEYTVTYTGVELKGIAAQRIIIPESEEAYQSYANVSPEYVIAQLITKHILAPSSTDREVVGTLADYTEGAESIAFNGRFDNVAEAIQSIANTYNIGWYADIQDNSIVWHIYRGVDRRKNQNENSRMVVSYKLDSFGSSSISNVNLLPNVALVAGQGEGVDRATVLVGSGTGLNRSEVYIDARDITDSTLLPSRGAEKLAEYGDPLTYETTFSIQFINLYRNPYDLGDIGTIEDDRLASGEVDFLLTEITEVYEGDNLRLDAVFGYDKQSLASAIKRTTGNTQALINLESASEISPTLDSMPVGFNMPWWSDTLPSSKYMFMEGQSLANYPLAKAVFGDNLPDLRGRVMVHKSTDTEFNTIKKMGGEKGVTLTVAHLPQYVVYDTGQTDEAWGLHYNTSLGYRANPAYGTQQAHNNLQPYIVCRYIAKVMP